MFKLSLASDIAAVKLTVYFLILCCQFANLITVFSRIEAAASIDIFVKKCCFYVRPASFNGVFCNNLGSLIWYHLCNLYARCRCMEINLLYQTGFYLLFSLSKLRLVFEGGFYSRKYGTLLECFFGIFNLVK